LTRHNPPTQGPAVQKRAKLGSVTASAIPLTVALGRGPFGRSLWRSKCDADDPGVIAGLSATPLAALILRRLTKSSNLRPARLSRAKLTPRVAGPELAVASRAFGKRNSDGRDCGGFVTSIA
jgi:hypothetical protein